MASFSRSVISPALLVLLAPLLTNCGGPKAVRGEEVAGLDDQAMSTGLDKRDLDKMLRENLRELQASVIVREWQQEAKPVVVAIARLRNDTTEHIDSQLGALLSDIESTLVNAGHVRVVSLENQNALIEQVHTQTDSGEFAEAVRQGKQVGAQFVVTGKIFAADERQDGERRVQYFMFIQVLDVETSQVRFQYKTAVTKAII